MTESFYDVLGVPADASQDEVTAAYRRKAKEHHPDVSEEPDAEERFKRVKRAEEVLTDPEERQRYDRLGHERYVAGATAGEPTSDSVRTAAAWAADRTADASHDAGGRSAGWRERERRARGDPADWFQNDVGYDASRTSWRSDRSDGRTTGSDDSGGSGGTGADGAGAGAAAGSAAEGARPGGTGRGAGASRSGTRSADERARASGSRRATATAAAGAGPRGQAGVGARPGHAANEAWGHNETRAHTHAVHEWRESADGLQGLVPRLTQDEFVFLGSSILLYPLLLAMTVFPLFPLAVNAVIGLLTLGYVVFLIPRPALALPIFGTWSVGVPAVLLALEIPLYSLPGAIGLGGTWIPFGYSVALAYVLVR